MKLHLTEAEKVICDYLIRNGPSTSVDIRNGLGKDVTKQFPRYTQDILREMFSSGMISRKPIEGSRKYRYYVRERIL